MDSLTGFSSHGYSYSTGEEYEGKDQEHEAHIHKASHLMVTHTALERSMRMEIRTMELTLTRPLISWLLIQHRRGA